MNHFYLFFNLLTEEKSVIKETVIFLVPRNVIFLSTHSLESTQHLLKAHRQLRVLLVTGL